MEVGRGDGDVAQRRYLNAPHRSARARGRCGRPAQAEVEVRRVGVGGDRRVARHAQVVVREVGEQRRCRRRRALGWHAAQLPLAGLLKSARPCSSRLDSVPDRRGTCRTCCRSDGSRRPELIGLQRQPGAGEGRVGVVEDRVAEQAAELIRVARRTELGGDGGRAAVGHLVRRQEGCCRLRLQRGRPAVPRQPAGRRALGVEAAASGQIARRRALRKPGGQAAPGGNHERVRGRVPVGRSWQVAQGHLARRRQRGIVKMRSPSAAMGLVLLPSCRAAAAAAGWRSVASTAKRGHEERAVRSPDQGRRHRNTNANACDLR